MCVDVSHLVFEALSDTNDQIVDEGSDCAESCNVLSCAVVKLDLDNVLARAGEVDSQVGEVLDKLSSWTFDSHESGLDGDSNCEEFALVIVSRETIAILLIL